MNHQSLSYVWEKLFTAVSNMAASERSPQERLINATTENISQLHGKYSKTEIPDEIQTRLNKLYDDLTSVLGPEGAIRATIEGMSDREVRDAIAEIVSIFSRVSELRGSNWLPSISDWSTK